MEELIKITDAMLVSYLNSKLKKKDFEIGTLKTYIAELEYEKSQKGHDDKMHNKNMQIKSLEEKVKKLQAELYELNFKYYESLRNK